MYGWFLLFWFAYTGASGMGSGYEGRIFPTEESCISYYKINPPVVDSGLVRAYACVHGFQTDLRKTEVK